MYKTLMNSIWDSLRLFKNNFVAICTIALPFLILLEIFEAFYIDAYLRTPFILDDLSPLLLSHITLKPFYTIAIIFYISSLISKETISVQQAWLLSLKKWPIYFILNLFTNLFIGIGFLFYVIPGIFLLIRFAFADFYLLLEKQSPLQAIKSSFTLTRHYFFYLSGGLLIMGVIIFYSIAMLNTIFNFQEFEINEELLTQMIKATSTSESQALTQGQLLIKFPEFSLLHTIVSIIQNLALISLTIFSFRIYLLAKEPAT